jgi:hypothetical protein
VHSAFDDALAIKTSRCLGARSAGRALEPAASFHFYSQAVARE